MRIKNQTLRMNASQAFSNCSFQSTFGRLTQPDAVERPFGVARCHQPAKCRVALLLGGTIVILHFLIDAAAN